MDTIKVLLLNANPEERNLRFQAEHRQIQEGVELSERQMQKSSPNSTVAPIEFVQASAARVRDLPRMLKLYAPQVLHFSGHGAPTGELIFETPEGRRAPLPPAVFAKLLTPFRSLLRLVFLNACYSQDQALGVADYVDVCIGMSRAVEDAVALIFAQAFYELIALGSSVGEAFHLACSELAAFPDTQNWSEAPRLFCRQGVDADQVFLAPLQAAPESSAPPAPPCRVELPPLQRLASLSPRELCGNRLRRIINDLFPADAELMAFLRDFYPRSARQISDGMQRTTKLNTLFTYEPNFARLRDNLIDFITSEEP